MTTEQLTWTDEQWAVHLGCAAQRVPQFKQWVRENYFIGIFENRDTKKKFIEIQRINNAPSGSVRFVPLVSTQPKTASLNMMVTEANTQVIPSLVLSDLVAEYNNVPPKVLQMLHIENQKQK